MKKIINKYTCVLGFAVALFLHTSLNAQVGVNTNTPNAMLDVSSTNNGFLLPRVALTSAVDAVTVVNPQGGALANATVVYNTATAGVSPNTVSPGFYYWNSSLLRWVPIGGTNDWSLFGNFGITTPANPVTYGGSTFGATEHFLGTKDANDLVLGVNNVERLRIKQTTGYVGIGTATPNEIFHVYRNTNTTKSAVLGEAIQTSAVADYQNRGVLGYGSGTAASGGYGFGIGVMGIGDRANSYYATGMYAYLGSSAPNAPPTNQALLANGNSLGNAALFTGGNVGIGLPLSTNPTHLLHINSATSGAVRIVDGTQGANKVLTSNATGVATWQPVGIESYQADLSAVTGVSVSYTQTANFIQTGASITLPPGRFAVNVSMLLSTVPGAYTNSNEAFWVRSSFSDSPGINPLSSADIIGSNLVSGNMVPSTLYSLLTGMVVINNTTAGNKTYYYVVGRVVTNNSTRTLAFFGGSYWAENNIIAYRLN